MGRSLATQESNQLLRELEAAFGASSDGIWVANAEGLTLRVNSAYERITGYAASELVNRFVQDLLAEGMFQHSVVLEVMRHKSTITLLNAIKDKKQLLVTGTPVFDDEGELWRVVCSVRDVTELLRLQRELELQSEMSRYYQTELESYQAREGLMEHGVVASSQPMRRLFEVAIQVARSNLSVCLYGESGVGKEVIANLIHRCSGRVAAPLIKVNCSAIPEALMESEFFGYERGAFTGAQIAGKPGFFELAHRGTLLLDEVGELPFSMQAKLLRVLQDMEVRRIGATAARVVDVRVIAATNHDLKALVEQKRFRSDLFYRLNVMPIEIPPLRERNEDIPLLLEHYLRLYNRTYDRTHWLEKGAVAALTAYSWPGNVRELRNLVERLVVMVDSPMIALADLPREITAPVRGSFQRDPVDSETLRAPAQLAERFQLHAAVEDYEAGIVKEALVKYGSLRQAAKALGISHVTVLRKVKQYGIKWPAH